MATVKRYTYPFDPTGRQASNLIQKEYHTITAANRTPQNVLIPGYAPFFRQSLVVTDLTTGQPLLEGIDYTCEWPVISASENSATEAYTPIYGGIQFIDNNITGQFSLTYQTIGGQYALDGIQIAQALANQANDPLVTKYEDIIGKPLSFPPLEHVHSIEDFVGFEDLCLAVIQLKEAIELLAREDRDTHPGYDTLVDAYFRLEEKLKQHQAIVDELGETFKDTILEIRKDTTKLINDYKDGLTNQLNRLKTHLETVINNLSDNLTNLINELKSIIDNDLKPNISKLKDRLDGDEFVKTDNEDQIIDGSKVFRKMLHVADGRINLNYRFDDEFRAGIAIEQHSVVNGVPKDKFVIKNDAVVNRGNDDTNKPYKLEFNDEFIKHQDKQLAYKEDIINALAKLDKFITGDRITNNTTDVEKLNRYTNDATLNNGFISGSVAPGQSNVTLILGEFPFFGPTTNSFDYVGLNLVNKYNDGQVTQFISLTGGAHYIRTKDTASSDWVNELILTSNNITKLLNPSSFPNVVYTTSDQEIDGIKTFKKVIKIDNLTNSNKPNKLFELGESTNGVYLKNTYSNNSIEIRDDNYVTYDNKRIPVIDGVYLQLGGVHTSNAGVRIQRFADTNWLQREQDWYIVAEAYTGTNTSGQINLANRLKFVRSAYTKHKDNTVDSNSRNITENNTALSISLPNSSGEIIVTGGYNHFRSSGELWSQLLDTSKLAPLMFTKATEVNDTKPLKLGTLYYPIMKALYRVNGVLNAKGNEQVAGWSYGIHRGDATGTRSAFIIHYADDSVDNTTNQYNTEFNNYFAFHAMNGGKFENTLGRYSLYRHIGESGLHNGLVLRNHFINNSWIKLRDDGELAISADNVLAVKYIGNYARIKTNVDENTKFVYSGFETVVNTIPYRFEIDPYRRFRLTRVKTTVDGATYPQVVHLFQDKSGTVAHLEDVNGFIHGQSVNKATAPTHLTKPFNEAKNGFVQGGISTSNTGIGSLPLLYGINEEYDFTGITMVHADQVTHLLSLGGGHNYIAVKDAANGNWDTSLILQSNNIGSFLNLHTGGTNNIDHGIVTYKNKDQTIDGIKTFSKLTNFNAGIKLNNQKNLTGNATKALYDGKTLAFESDVTALATRVTTLETNTKGITVSGGLKYNNSKVLLQSDYDTLKKLIDGKQASGSYVTTAIFDPIKNTVNSLGSNYVSLTATQSVNGAKTFASVANFTNGITIGTSKLGIVQAVQDSRNVLNMNYVKVTDIYVSSDRNLKENIQPIENALDKVTKLNGRTFDWKVSGRHTAGFIAQEVEKVIPDMVSTDNKGLKAVNYVDAIAYLVEAVKEQQKQIEALQAKLN